MCPRSVLVGFGTLPIVGAPWDVPVSVEGRDTLIRLAREYRDSGQQFELGCTLSRLAHVVKHVGAPGDIPAFQAAASVGDQAVEILRECGAKRELALALLNSAVPFSEIDYEAILNEALALSQEVGDAELEGWIRYRMTRANGVAGHTLEEALACFEKINCKLGIAVCLSSLGFQREPPDIEMMRKAVSLYEECGREEDAKRVRAMIWVSG